jgi:hypothetical protein
MTFDNDDVIHDFVANNTFIYNKLRDSEMVIFKNGYLFFR